MNICMISSEVLPFSKTGGLADVSYALSKEYAKTDNEVYIFTPFYDTIKLKNHKLRFVKRLKVVMNWREPEFNVYEVRYNKIHYYLIQNQQYFERGSLYGFFDDGERFAFFANACLEIIKESDIKFDIVHVHDWQSAMIPCILKCKYYDDQKLNKIKTVLTIHNPLFKGYLDKEALFDLFNLTPDIFYEGKVRLDDKVSTLKAGIYFADKITTVSKTHREELLTVEGSKGLNYDLELRSGDFCGIVNGIDYQEFNPRYDKLIKFNYSRSKLEGKEKNKVEFCKEFNLNSKYPIFSVVSRLTDQKGINLMYKIAETVLKNKGNFVLVGSGQKEIEDAFINLNKQYKDNSFIYIGYNNELAHKVYAASDFFVMPSAFEPCGIGQLIAERYGTLPIVRETGGLKDTVIAYNENKEVATGFKIYSFNEDEAENTAKTALNLFYNDKNTFKKLQNNAMKVDNSWKSSSKLYLGIYKELVRF